MPSQWCCKEAPREQSRPRSLACCFATRARRQLSGWKTAQREQSRPRPLACRFATRAQGRSVDTTRHQESSRVPDPLPAVATRLARPSLPRTSPHPSPCPSGWLAGPTPGSPLGTTDPSTSTLPGPERRPANWAVSLRSHGQCHPTLPAPPRGITQGHVLLLEASSQQELK